MPDIYEIANDLGIAPVEDTGTEQETSDDFLVNAAMEDRVNELFDPEATSKEQPVEDAPATPAVKNEKAPPEKGVKPEANQEKTNQAAPTFEESSKQAFLNSEGEIDVEKVSGYFIDKNNAVDFSSIKDEPLSSTPDTETIETPEDKYHKDVSGIVDSLPDVLKKEQESGFTPEETLQRLINTFNGFSSEREARKGLLMERDGITKQFKDELNQVRADRVNTQIRANTSELGAHYDSLIPGMKGTEVLSSFMLEKKYGGKMLDTLFRKDNPGFAKLPDEEQKTTTEKWFGDFQANKKDMAMVSEFGRAMWLLEQLPGIIQHSQQIGATKKANERESQIGGPSKVNRDSQGGSSGLGEFFGYDSVN